jgi:DUF1365 family protein
MQMKPSLYVGRVRHTRIRPFHHDFEYRVFYGLFDVDRLDELDQEMRLMSASRFNLFSLHRADHGPTDGSPLRPWAEELLSRAGVDLEGGQIMLLAFPRILGYAFNPISEWYCYGPGGELRALIHEVRNTFGDRHAYVVPVSGNKHRFEKRLHVSPFNDMNRSYGFTVSEPGRRLALAIDVSDDAGTMFRAGTSLSRLPLTDRNLMKLFWTHPLLTVKVIGGIHWQALRLWLKGAEYHRRPKPAKLAYTIVETKAIAS